MQNNIIVSIIIPYYNAPHHLSKLLNELLKQSYSHRLIEIVVVDDGSVQPAAPVVETNQTEFTGFANFILIRHPFNKGRASARNSGVEISSGEILMFCDVDDYPNPSYIEKIVGLHMNNRHVSVRANIRILPEIRRYSAYLRYKDSRYVGARGKKAMHRIDINNMPATFFSTCGVSVERSDMIRVGFFDEEFSGYGGEDEELGFRLFRNGVRLVFCADALMWDTDDSLTLDRVCSKYRQYGLRNGVLLFTKHPDFRKYSPFSKLEPINFKSDGIGTVIIKLLMRMVLLPWVAHLVRKALSMIDHLPYNPPNLLYKYVFSASYLEGVRERNTAKDMNEKTQKDEPSGIHSR